MTPISSEKNRFNGREIISEDLPSDPVRFGAHLDASIDDWSREGVSLVWLDLELHQAELIPVAIARGFEFHSTIVTKLRLARRIDTHAHVPGQSTHYIGAGGAVFSDDGRLLVVAERYGHTKAARHYKLPGGALHPQEHIVDAVQREIREETGIETRFLELICFRHWHQYRDDKSDIYFVCRLEPVTYEIHRQADEIEECLWMPVAEYLQHERTHDFNRRIVQAALAGTGLVPTELDGYGSKETHELFMPGEKE